MKSPRQALIFVTFLVLLSQNQQINPDPVDSLDLAQYAGLWYEIARMPNPFQQNCYCTMAEYSLNSDGTVGVRNSCNLDSAKGTLDQIEGVALPLSPVEGTVTKGDLEVRLSNSPPGSYRVLSIGENYKYALVGSAGFNFLWILSRTPTLDNDIYSMLLDEATQRGYDVNRLTKTYQGKECSKCKGKK